MAKELAYVLINPYSVAKSRTGGIMARYLSRSGLELVGAGMYGPSAELATAYAQSLRDDSGIEPEYANTLADYVLRSYMPESASGKRKRVMLLLFEGEDAIAKVLSVTGPLRKNMEAGETIRDTFGDYIVDPDGKVIYVEPAVLCGQDQAGTAAALKLWASYEQADSGVILNAGDTHPGDDLQQTLVIIKPDNFRFPSVRPGNIIDMFSRSGLRIVGAKLHRMSCAEGEEFYGPVRAVLREKLKDKVVNEICAAATERLDLELPADVKQQVGDLLGPIFGDRQFGDIVQFMTGCRPESTPAEKKGDPGSERCLALVYSGAQAVDTIRSILGPTDPSKAGTGTVRRELGQNIMVNAAHASDSVENAQREMKIIDFSAPSVTRLVEQYYA